MQFFAFTQFHHRSKEKRFALFRAGVKLHDDEAGDRFRKAITTTSDKSLKQGELWNFCGGYPLLEKLHGFLFFENALLSV